MSKELTLVLKTSNGHLKSTRTLPQGKDSKTEAEVSGDWRRHLCFYICITRSQNVSVECPHNQDKLFKLFLPRYILLDIDNAAA